MQMTAGQLAMLVGGRVEGNEEVLINKPGKIQDAESGDITFLSNPKYEEYIYTTEASVVLVSNDFQPKMKISATLIRVDDVYSVLGSLLDQFGNGMTVDGGIDNSAIVSQNVQLGDNVSIGPFSIISDHVNIGEGTSIFGQVYVGANVKIGKGCIIYPGVKIYANCILGDHCIIHSNAVIGSDGFGFSPDADGVYKKIEQIGNVILEDYVEIGAATTIDRATMGSTVIKNGAKLDNLIQVAHNVVIGENAIVAAQAGIAGSTIIDDDCLIGGQAGIAGHIKLGKRTKVQAGTGVPKSTKEDSKLYGYPAMDYTQYLRSYAVFKRLPEILKRLEMLEKRGEKG